MDFRQRYQFDALKDLIGKGGFAKVYKATDTLRKRTVALKFYTGVESDKYDIISEINRMDDIVHPNLIRYYDADMIEGVNALGEREKTQVGILEYANHGDISSFFKVKRTPATYKSIIFDILKGLQYLHMNGIAHRDLKPKNILLSKEDNGRITAKIADFGISKRVGSDDATLASQLLGSVEYMPPEQFAPAVYGIDGKLDTNVDLWSIGIIIYEIFTQNLPFGSRSKGITYEQILNNILFQDLEIDFTVLDEPYRTIVERCLIKKATLRARQAEELIDILKGEKRVETVLLPVNNNQETTPIKVPNPDDKTNYINDTDKPTISHQQPDNQQQNNNNDETRVIEKDRRNLPSNNNNADGNNRNNLPPTKYVKEVNKTTVHEISTGKNLFKLGNYPESFKYLNKYLYNTALDTEAKFYLGFMYYNGKCGGAHDVDLGRELMHKARDENRPLVLELMSKIVNG